MPGFLRCCADLVSSMSVGRADFLASGLVHALLVGSAHALGVGAGTRPLVAKPPLLHGPRCVAPHSARALQQHCVRACAPDAEDLSGDGGCVMRTLRAADPDARLACDGEIAQVSFRASLSNGTALLDDGLLVMREESTTQCAWHEPGYYPACPPWSRDVELATSRCIVIIASIVTA